MRRVWLPLLLCLLFALPCRAEGADGALEELYDTLPDGVTEALPDSLASALAEGKGAEAASELELSFFFSLFAGTVRTTLGSCAAPLLTLGGGILLAAFLSHLSDLVGGGREQGFSFASGLALTLSIFDVIRPLWDELTGVLTGIGTIIKSALPILTAIGSASGTVSSTTVHAAWLTALLTLLEQLCETVLIPLLAVCFGFLLVNSVARSAEAPELSGILQAIRQTFLWLLTLLATLLSAVMAFQSVLAKGSDTVLVRSIKFAAGTAIPVVGGAIGEAAGSYLAGLAVIRSSAGTLTAAALVISTLPLILKLFFLRFGFALVSGMAELLGAKREGQTVKEAASLIDLALALVSLCSVLFLLVIGVFSAGAVGVSS